MSLRSRCYPKLYKDSVSLMTVSAQVLAVAGVETASVVMASATNVENLAAAGLGRFEVRPNDLVVAVAGSDEACDAALARADELLKAGAADSADTGGVAAAPLTSLQTAVSRDPAHNLALISVPGDYAAAEAMKALRLGMDVMMFSDNVSPEAELALKQFAQSRDLMVMGPDCGTAIVNGVPLGFANVVRRGAIGVVGASGTGTQEVTVLIHQLGGGISQALGTGGHDLAAAIGGISMLHGLKALADDPATEVIVLVSKPPAPTVAAAVLAAAEACAKPVVAIFLGADPATITRRGVHGAATLAQAAEIAVALARGQPVPTGGVAVAGDARRRLAAGAASMAPSQRQVRGVFCGGTFCFEAQAIHAAAGFGGFSNTPTAGWQPLAEPGRSPGHTIIDMGDDRFTQGRPHPMIDPSQRDARIRQELADPATAVVLFDVVLGYGAAAAPIAGLVEVLREGRAAARAAGREVACIGHVCGTDQDPQGRAETVSALRAEGVLVAANNAEAATWSAAVLAERLAEHAGAAS
ncbi:MAG: acyl-CoA synthetase FdrA [Burkholderiaceae bacterium]|nr:acyl-CoA synthetase FdrA [Burkholderiaceae bacterium]